MPLGVGSGRSAARNGHDAWRAPTNHSRWPADQQDRGEGKYGPETAKRDQVRLQRARAIVAAGELDDAEDHFYAAMIFQHGSSLDDF